MDHRTDHLYVFDGSFTSRLSGGDCHILRPDSDRKSVQLSGHCMGASGNHGRYGHLSGISVEGQRFPAAGGLFTDEIGPGCC